MRLELTKEQAQELEGLLAVTMSELSHEIAATDNASYRAELRARRERLFEIAEALETGLASTQSVPEELVRELSRPGD
jgi:hypothetical protein